MAVKKTVEIDIKSNSKKADKDLKEIKKDIDAIGKSAKKKDRKSTRLNSSH